MKRCLALKTLAYTLLLSALGIVSSPNAFAAALEKPNITFGVLPITNYAVIYLALKQGFFQEEGLNVTPRMMGTASSVAAIVGGDFDVSGTTWTLFLLSINRGIDLVPISEADRGVPGNAMYMVRNDSALKTIGDLLGKKVGIVSIGGTCDYLLDDSLRSQGLDYKTIAFTAIGVPDMAPTLLRGGIDAACIPEPILTSVKAQGTLRPVMDLFGGANDRYPIVGFDVTAQFAAANPNTVAALKRALAKGLKYASQNPDQIRAIYPTYTTLKPEDAQKITMSYIPPESDFTQVKRVADLMKRLGVLPENAKIPAIIQPQ